MLVFSKLQLAMPSGLSRAAALVEEKAAAAAVAASVALVGAVRDHTGKATM